MITLSAIGGGVPGTTAELDDATATQFGFKAYLHGTNYAGGNSPTTACAQAGFAVVRAVYVPYATQDGTWRLKFNIVGTFTAASISTLTVTTNGILAKNIANYTQSIAAWFTTSSGSAQQSYIGPNTNQFITNKSIGSCAGVIHSGDIELDSKPTWAY